MLVDNVLVGEPTVLDGFSNSFAFAVNEGSVVDMNYISEFSGWPGNFEVVDTEGTVLFDSDARPTPAILMVPQRVSTA